MVKKWFWLLEPRVTMVQNPAPQDSGMQPFWLETQRTVSIAEAENPFWMGQ